MSIFHNLKIKKVVQETSDAISVEFEKPAELENDFQYIQGQHLTLKAKIDGEELRRSYSICSAVSEQKLRVAIKQIENGKFSTYAKQNFREGDVLEVMVPQGRFFTDLDPSNTKNYLCVAAGSGITPILSIVKSILETEPQSSVSLVYGNRTVSSILFLEELEDLKNKYPTRMNLLHILSREEQDSELFNGRISAEKCAQILDGPLKGIKVDDAFICGPEQMTLDVKSCLISKGVDKSNIHFELFITDAAIADSRERVAADKQVSGPNHVVKVVLDGSSTEVTIAEEGVSILDAALEAGVDVPFACKGGVCSTCRAKVLQGDVRMDINYALEDDEVDDGYVLTCQSHPLSDDVIVDFDQ
ncbi:1,2-phenylacetyl-CoA epoxidase subunit PaaE [Sneathiella glossodoripedis]|uniref:1,2-phenylacetyl-CoA epoxidase subunit PaaE n=1 Tax=Sneathiella glossodoripedis TaxID=418853 RepID=UPI00046E5735|nr:1,2-phenylacetyl-CoA epoxidase subunit PaaE [Sneathiella glossodoripedis]